MSGVLAVGVVGFLILLVIALYSVGREGTSPALAPQENAAGDGGSQPLVVPQPQEDTTVAGPAGALPDLIGQSLEDAIAIVEGTGASYVVVGVKDGDAPVGQIVGPRPGPGRDGRSRGRGDPRRKSVETARLAVQAERPR